VRLTVVDGAAKKVLFADFARELIKAVADAPMEFANGEEILGARHDAPRGRDAAIGGTPGKGRAVRDGGAFRPHKEDEMVQSVHVEWREPDHHGQEAGVRAIEHWRNGELPRRPENWLVRVAYNLLLNDLRRQQRMVALPEELPTNSIAGPWMTSCG
jgi:hypothetical protein